MQCIISRIASFSCLLLRLKKYIRFQEFESLLSRLWRLNKLATDRPMCSPGYSNVICYKCIAGQQWLDDPLSWLLNRMTWCIAVGQQCRHTLAFKQSFSRRDPSAKNTYKMSVRWIRLVTRWNLFMLIPDNVSKIVSKKGDNIIENYKIHIRTQWCQSHFILTVKLVVSSVKPWKIS
jgi:hypothetical protein